MTIIEHGIAAVDSADAATNRESGSPVANHGYQAVRFNAIKHGILSRHVVLPHEDADEFRRLLDALLDEHRPVGATEAHLVEELASILWRKRRVLQAEGASINEGMASVLLQTDRLVSNAVPFAAALAGRSVDVREMMSAFPDDVARQQREAKDDLAAAEGAASILGRGEADAYDQALQALPPDWRDLWLDQVETEDFPATAEGLGDFIHQDLLPMCRGIDALKRHHEAIKAQAMGEGLKEVHRLENLGRYETHLDRKFERTLAMLIKLKQLRAATGGGAA